MHLSENVLFLRFFVLPGSAETLFRCSGKMNQLLIAQSLSNVGVKHCESRIIFARVAAKNVRDVFETQCKWKCVYVVCVLFYAFYGL